MQIDNKVFDLVANVRKKPDNSFVYSIQLNENKKIEASPPLGLLSKALNRALNASDKSISQSSDSVKSKSSERNSNGEKLFKGQVEFFKDSKVRDADGNLLVVYHGTPNKFTTFRQNVADGWGRGIYFTDNKAETADYGENIVEAYLNITNPFNADTMSYDEIGAENTNAYRKFDKEVWRKRFDEYDTYEEYKADGMGADLYEIYTEEVEVFNQILRELGYDGIIADGSNNINGLEIVAFDEKQVKLTTNKNPTSNPDIRYSERGKVTEIENSKYREMVDHFGMTRNFDVAGYMLVNGAMLDFSGKHWGDDYSTSRQVDHRDLQEVLESKNNGIDAMLLVVL